MYYLGFKRGTYKINPLRTRRRRILLEELKDGATRIAGNMENSFPFHTWLIPTLLNESDDHTHTYSVMACWKNRSSRVRCTVFVGVKSSLKVEGIMYNPLRLEVLSVRKSEHLSVVLTPITMMYTMCMCVCIY